MIAKRASLDGRRLPALRRLVSAGEPLNPEVMEVFRAAMELDIHDGYGQTETGQLTGMPAGERGAPRLDGQAAARVRARGPRRGRAAGDRRRAVPRPRDRADLLPRLPRRAAARRRRAGAPATACAATTTAILWFEGRLDDVILSAGYRIGPFEVESALVEHPAVAEAAAVAAPDAERGVGRRGRGGAARRGTPGDEQLVRELQDHVKRCHRSVQVPAHRASSSTSCRRPRAGRSSGPSCVC